MSFEAVSPEYYQGFKQAVKEWLLASPGEYFLTLGLDNGLSDLGQITKRLVRWLGSLKKLCRTNLAFQGVLTRGISHPHLHGFLWGWDHRGVSLSDNRRFPARLMNNTTFKLESMGWPGSIDIRPIHDPQGLAAYIACGNANVFIFEPVIIYTSKEMIKKGGH